MSKCPKCNHDRMPNDKECPRCGIIYEKFESYIDKKKTLQESEEPVEIERIDKTENRTVSEDNSKSTTGCRHCGREVAISAEKCPHCGGETPGLTKQQAETAKSIQAVIGIIFLVLIIMVARSCWKAGDELEKAGTELGKAAEEMKRELGK